MKKIITRTNFVNRNIGKSKRKFKKANPQKNQNKGNKSKSRNRKKSTRGGKKQKVLGERELVRKRKSLIEKSNKKKVKKLFYGHRTSVGDIRSNYLSMGGRSRSSSKIKIDEAGGGKKTGNRLEMPLKA